MKLTFTVESTEKDLIERIRERHNYSFSVNPGDIVNWTLTCFIIQNEHDILMKLGRDIMLNDNTKIKIDDHGTLKSWLVLQQGLQLIRMARRKGQCLNS